MAAGAAAPSFGLAVACYLAVSVCMSVNQCTSVYSCILVGVWDWPVLSIPDPSLVSSLVNKQGLR